MKKRKLLSLAISFCLLFSQLIMIPALAVEIEEADVINIERNINGSEFEIGEKINVEYTIMPENIIYTNQQNKKEKDIVLIIDQSGSMNEKIDDRNNNGRGHAYGHNNRTKLDIVKEVSKEFIDKFKDDSSANLNIIGYSDQVNFIYNNKSYNFYDDIVEGNIIDICNSLDIDKEKIYYKYNYRQYKVNNIWYEYDKKLHNDYFYRIDLNEFPNVDGLEFYYYDDEDMNKIFNVYDLISQNMIADGSTNIGDALRRGYYLLNNNNGHEKYIVILTDGQAEAYSENLDGQFKMDDGEAQVVKWTEWKDIGWYGIYAEPDYRTKSLEYAKKIGLEKIKPADINNFFIGFGNGANDDDGAAKNIQIAQSTGGKYYNALNEHEINNIYDEIGRIIEINKSAKVHFEEQIPEGVIISDEDIENLPDGLRVQDNKIIGDLEERVFYKAIKDENGDITELRADPVSFNITFTANTINEACTFGEKSTSFVRYAFEDNDEIITKYFEPNTIKINQHAERGLVNIERILETSNSKNGTFDVKYRIVPERIRKNDILNSNSNNNKKDIVLVLDTSGSMDWDIDGNETDNEYNKRLSIMKNTAIEFINNIGKDNNVRIGLVQYNSSIENSKSISSGNIENLIDDINSMNSEGGTNIGEGLRKAYKLLDNNSSKDKYIILMSDGFPTAFTAKEDNTDYEKSYNEETDKGKILDKNKNIDDYFILLKSTQFETDVNANKVEFVVNYGDNDDKGYALEYAKQIGNKIKEDNKEIKTFVIGFSNGANSEKLQQISNSAAGKYFQAIDGNAMEKVYEDIQQIVETNVSAKANFEENIDGNIEIVNANSLPYEMHLEDGKLVGDISNIYYTLSEDEGYYEAEPIEFTVTYKPRNNDNIVFGQNNSSFVNYTISEQMNYREDNERVYFDKLELNAPEKPIITQDNILYEGKVKVIMDVNDNSIIEYRLEGENDWNEYSEALYLEVGTTIYGRSKNSILTSDEVSFTTNAENDSVNMVSEEIVKQGIYINGKVKVVDDINIVNSIPTELGALLKLSSENTMITLDFVEQISDDVSFRLLDANNDSVNISVLKGINNQYEITSSNQLNGDYILVYKITATIPNEKTEVKININGNVEDIIEINIMDLPLLE